MLHFSKVLSKNYIFFVHTPTLANVQLPKRLILIVHFSLEKHNTKMGMPLIIPFIVTLSSVRGKWMDLTHEKEEDIDLDSIWKIYNGVSRLNCLSRCRRSPDCTQHAFVNEDSSLHKLGTCFLLKVVNDESMPTPSPIWPGGKSSHAVN